MKKYLVWLLVLAITLCTGAWADGLHDGEQEPTEEQLAQMLYDLHLFQGTDKGFELDRTMSRAEAAVMVTRFFGGEQEALEYQYKTKFTDVPAWAKPYVGWLYHWGLTKGVSATKYGSGQGITFAEYCVMLERRFNPETTYDQCMRYGCQVAFYDTLREKGHLILRRGEGVAISAGALSCILETNQNLVEKLLEQGVFTLEEFDHAAAPIYGYEYSGEHNDADNTARACKTVLRVVVARGNPVPGFLSISVTRDDFMFAHVYDFANSKDYLYRVDCDSLQTTLITQLEDDSLPSPWGQQGDLNFFVEKRPDGDCTVLASDGVTCRTIQGPGLFYNNRSRANINLNAYRTREFPEGLFLCCDAGLYRVNSTGTALEYLTNMENGVRDVAAAGDGLYFTTYTIVRESEDYWNRVSNHQIWKLDANGNQTLYLDAEALALSPQDVLRYEDGKLYFIAYDQGHVSPKAYIIYEYCYDGERVSVSGARGDGVDVAIYTAEELGQQEQARLDALYGVMGGQ